MTVSGLDLVDITERAAFLQERFGEEYIPAQESGDTAARMDLWRLSAALGDGPAFERRLQWDGITADRARAALGRIRLANPAVLPGWTEFLAEWVEACARLAAESTGTGPERFPFCRPEEPVAFEEIFAPLVEVASRRVQHRASSALAQFAAKAYRALERGLLVALSSVAAEVLNLEFGVFRSTRQMGGSFVLSTRALYSDYVARMWSGSLVALLHEYPVLARFLATATDFWVERTSKFLNRLEQDRRLIGERFCDGADPGPVADLRPSLSDRHNGGQSTIRVCFESGLAIYYKPKDIRSEDLYYRLLEWLNLRGAQLPFRIFRVLNRGTHGWAEEAPHLPCRDRDEVERYYRRAGMLLCLLYALEASDCHSENIIASGEHPVLIDMETLLQPRPRTGVAEDATFLASRMLHWDSVYRTALLPRWAFGTSGESYDVSGLGAVEDQATGIPAAVWEHVNTDRMRLRRQTVLLERTRNVVELDGKAVAAGDYLDEVVAGFDEMYRFLASHSGEMLAPGGPLEALRGIPVRFVRRDTKNYAALLAGLLLPQHLRDGADAGIRLDSLARPELGLQERGPSWDIFHAERKALSMGDIPYFCGLASDDALRLGTGRSLPGYFVSPGFDLLRERFARLSESDRERQKAYIRASFASRANGGDAFPGPRAIEGTEATDAVPPGRFLEEAVAIARAIREAAILSAGGDASWLTMAYYAEAGRRQLEPMTPRFYDGAGGVALFLAALDRATGSGEFRDLALGALRGIRHKFSHPFCERILAKFGIGAGGGTSSIVYSLVRCADLLGEPELLEDAVKVANAITPERIAADTALDLLGGASGAIPALLALHRATGRADALDKAELCGCHLLEARRPGGSGFRAWPTLERKLLSGFAHGAAGIAYALAGLARVTGKTEFLEAAREGFAYESGLYDTAARDWPDVRSGTCLCSWCHGAPGIALGRLGALDTLDEGEIRRDLDRALDATARHPVTGTDHLCCGNLGRAEVLLEAARKLDVPAYRERALSLAASAMSGARANGSYGLDLQPGVYMPSFHQGMAGIGYAMLRLACPEAPCLLLWE